MKWWLMMICVSLLIKEQICLADYRSFECWLAIAAWEHEFGCEKFSKKLVICIACFAERCTSYSKSVSLSFSKLMLVTITGVYIFYQSLNNRRSFRSTDPIFSAYSVRRFLCLLGFRVGFLYHLGFRLLGLGLVLVSRGEILRKTRQLGPRF